MEKCYADLISDFVHPKYTTRVTYGEKILNGGEWWQPFNQTNEDATSIFSNARLFTAYG